MNQQITIRKYPEADLRSLKAITAIKDGRAVLIEEQREQLDEEVLELDLQIDQIKKKVVSAESLGSSLTTFRKI